MKTNTSGQPKVNAAIRVGAALCVFLWVAGSALCNLECLCNCTDHTRAGSGHAESPYERDTGHCHDAAEAHGHAAASHHHDESAMQDDHGCKGKKCCDEDACCSTCCSTIQAFVVTPTPVVIAKPVSQPAPLISFLCVAHEHVLTAPVTESLRQAKPRDWVFTPEVCLGPALHGLAPPASV